MPRSTLLAPVLVCLLLAAALPLAAGDAAPRPEDLFDLRVLAPWYHRADDALRVRVQVVDAYRRAPLSGAEVSAVLTLDPAAGDTEQVLGAAATTDADGEAALAFAVTTDGWRDASLAVSARARGTVRRVELELSVAGGVEALLATDKWLYQPGQTVHVRGLLRGRRDRPLAGREVTVVVRDQEDRPVHRAVATASPFGVVDLGWTLPDRLPAGRYRIQAAASSWHAASAHVRVARYELPRFAVEATPSRQVYLPGQRASLAVAVRRLTGEPVAGAALRLRVASRGQGDQTVALPAADDRGRATVEVDLSPAHRQLAENPGRQYFDLEATLTATDPLSGRDERAVTALRVSRQPLHVYLLPGPALEGGMASCLATAFYADGRPAAARVTLHAGERLIGALDTDVYGVGRTMLDAEQLAALDEDGTVEVVARDAEGATGTATQTIGRVPQSLRVDSPRVLLPRGAPLTVTVTPARPLGRVLVTLRSEERTLDERILGSLHAASDVTFRYRPSMRGVLTVAATSLDPAAGDDPPAAVHSVLYPQGPGLRLDLRAGDAAPGATAAVDLQLHGAGGVPAIAGLAVVDGAVGRREESFDLGGAGPAFLASARRAMGLGGTEIAGWTLDRLRRLDPDSPRTELDTLARVLLRYHAWPNLRVTETDAIAEATATDRAAMRAGLAPLVRALEKAFTAPRWSAPDDLDALRALAGEAGIGLDRLRDAWGLPYRFAIEVRGRQRVMVARSAGLDRTWGTVDDVVAREHGWDYLRPVGRAIDRAVADAYRARGVLLRDAPALAAALAGEGVDWAALRDPWGRPYRLRSESHGRYLTLDVVRDRGPGERVTGDEVSAWHTWFDWGALVRRQVAAALRTGAGADDWPRDGEQARARLRAAGLDLARWPDPWGTPVRLRAIEGARYSDRWRHDAAAGAARLEPVTERFVRFELLSAGPDARFDSDDDLVVGWLRRPLAWQRGGTVQGAPAGALLSAGQGLLRVAVTDDAGEALPGVTLTLDGDRPTVGITTADGSAVFTLAAGAYRVLAELDGFSTLDVLRVEVHAGQLTELPLTLSPAVEETITVTAESPALATAPSTARPPRPPAIATPRLRHDFPETLFWLPEAGFDDQGRLRVPVPLADSVTAWQVLAVASTLDGRLAVAETSLTATQPLVVESDPPPVATAGDRLALPVYVHNRSAEAVDLGIEVETDAAIESAPPSPASLHLAAGASRRLEVPMTLRAAGDAAVTVRAIGDGIGDAVRRRLSIRADGRQRDATVSRLVRGGGALSLAVPATALAGTARLEVRAYAGLAQHLRGALEALRRRPTGCAEQTLSRAYPWLLLARRQGADVEMARRQVTLGVGSLAGFRGRGGGVAYWRGGEGDPALTAYALDFLLDAAGLVEVDTDRLGSLARWLARRQRADGRWTSRWPGAPPMPADLARSALIGAILARVPAALLAPEDAALVHAALAGARRLLAARAAAAEDPYALAGFLLMLADEPAAADVVAARRQLRALGRRQRDGVAWHLRANTPFYGRAAAGRVETTALAVRALVAHDAMPDEDPLLAGAVAFLLTAKDADGWWSSTQATVQALRALDAAIGEAEAPGGGDLGVTLDGAPLGSSSTPDSLTRGLPSVLEAPASLTAGEHTVALETAAGDPGWTLVQAVLRWVEPWSAPGGEEVPGTSSGGEKVPGTLPEVPGTLRYAVDCAPLTLAVGEPVTCDLAVERVGFRGYGMLIAEVGLPPGAEVDRASLEAAPGVYDHEVWPDRVILYLWPRAGGERLRLRWRPRLAMTAKAAPSQLYDYYHPADRRLLAPATFRVTPAPSVAAARRR